MREDDRKEFLEGLFNHDFSWGVAAAGIGTLASAVVVSPTEDPKSYLFKLGAGLIVVGLGVFPILRAQVRRHLGD